jgi:hypothetical protein
VDRIEQLFLLARQHCGDDIDAWPAQVWRHIAAQGKRLVRDGVRLEGEAENLAELATQARLFARTRLPCCGPAGDLLLRNELRCMLFGESSRAA